jgi:hypothetical protein
MFYIGYRQILEDVFRRQSITFQFLMDAFFSDSVRAFTQGYKWKMIFVFDPVYSEYIFQFHLENECKYKS